MIAQQDLQTRLLRVNVFVANAAFARSKVLARLLREFAEVLDGEPISFPLPDSAPRDIPSIILSSADDSTRIEVSPSFIVITRSRETLINGEEGAAFLDWASRVATEYQRVTESSVVRLALVSVKRSSEVVEPQSLAEEFCDRRSVEGPFKGSIAFEIHSLKRFPLAETGWIVNDWVRSKSHTFTSPDGTTTPRLTVEQDVNTLHQEESAMQFEEGDIPRFLAAAKQAMDATLNLHFPNDGGSHAN